MSEEFNIFKNLEDLRKINILDQLKNLKPAKSIDLDHSQGGDNDDDFNFDNFVTNNVRKSPVKRQSKEESHVTLGKEPKKKAKSRRSSISTDGSLSPTFPLLENLSKKIDDLPLSRRTRRSLAYVKTPTNPVTEQQPPEPNNTEPSSSKSRGRGRGRGKGRGRGRGRSQNTLQNHDCSIDLSDNCLNVTPSNEVSEVESDNQGAATLTLIEQFSQRGRNSGRSRVMRARRQYVAEKAAHSTQVDFIDLVSSPLPRVEGMIVLDSDTEEPKRTTRGQKRARERFSFNSKNNTKTTTKPELNISFDEDNPELNIKVNWKGKHEAFHLRKYQKFSVIFKKLAERENINTENIVFNLNDRLILPDDTPDSIGYKFFHFIDGRVLMNRFSSPGAASAATKKRDINKITLKIQSDKWKRPLQIDLMKTDKFRILYIKCAEELKVNIEQLKLSFDGEYLELNDTPADLDLEGGEAIDLRIKN